MGDQHSVKQHIITLSIYWFQQVVHLDISNGFCDEEFCILSEGEFSKAVSEYEIYYNTERPHQNLDNELISPKENEHYEELRLTRVQNKGKVLYKSAKDRSLIVKKQRLGGILNFYYRKAS